MSKTKYINKNVLEASKERISYIFDNFENIVVSISGGKDSTVLCHLALTEAHKRNRKISLFWLDEEVVYNATCEQIEYLMNLYPENTIRKLYQIPFNLTNSASLKNGQMDCWEKGKHKIWMHTRNTEKNIISPDWSHQTIIADKEKGFGYYDVIENIEMAYKNTAVLVGLRGVESPNRWRAMVKNPGFKKIYWSTKRKGENTYSFYPLYDWNVSDIWKYIAETGIKYHKYYDFAFLKGVNPNLMRVSSLTHEKSFKAIQDLPEFEPKTYEKLLKRIDGISFAQETAKDKKMFKSQKLPKNFKTWIEYRDFLLETYPIENRKELFKKRFFKYLNNEYVAKQECKQLILNDYENNFPVKNKEDPIQEKIKYYMEVL